VWPENASDLDPEKNPIAKKEISDLLVRINKPILVGAVERSNAGPLNVSILYKPDGNKIRYVKQDLAPFGEYIPLRSLAERIEPTAKRVVDFQPGREPVVFQLEKDTFATLICFEILDDDLVRRSTRGASFLINQTNNATFGKSNQAAQQLQIASARAAELQKSLVAVSTTGFTSYIDSSGRSIATLPQFQPGSLSAEVVTNEGRSLASSLGSFFWFGFGALALGLRRLRYLNR
jgi:apolipoprotein N-acyltransferase